MPREPIKLNYWRADGREHMTFGAGQWWVGHSDFMVFERDGYVYACRRSNLHGGCSSTYVYSGDVAAALSVAAAAGAWQTVYDIALRNFEVCR